jgi:succinate dehydrogenase cytochrome b556 subunit
VKWNAVNWYLHRVSGGMLLLLLIAHFWVQHFASEALLREGITYHSIEHRLRMPLWQAIDIAFLAVALYHGLNGLRNILLDYSRISCGMARILTTLLVAVGVLWMYWGVEAFRNL